MELVAIQGAMLATPGTAWAWARVLKVHPRARITSPAGAFRSEAMVLDMWESSPARRLAVYHVPLGVGVARPKSLGGLGSVHENGRCVDVNEMLSAYRPALVDAGFVNIIRTEPWHWEYRGPEGGGTGGGDGGGTATTVRKDPQMSAGMQVYQMVDEAGNDVVPNDFTRAGFLVLPTKAFPQGGYEATTNGELARDWGREVAGPLYPFVKRTHDQIVAIQQQGVRDYALHRAEQIARIREALGAGGTGTTVNLQPILDAIAAGEAQDAQALQLLLAKLDGVDEATLATFGLKRA